MQGYVFTLPVTGQESNVILVACKAVGSADGVHPSATPSCSTVQHLQARFSANGLEDSVAEPALLNCIRAIRGMLAQ